MTDKQHGGPRENSGRPLQSGEPMRPRQIRMTDQQWADARLVGADAIRQWVTIIASKIRDQTP